MKNIISNIFNKTKPLLPTLTIGLVVILLGILNFKSGTIFTGWDNLHPEYNFPANIQRSIFAVWQEYQGLGLLGGMGHATDLVRQIFLLLLSVFIPVEALRYITTIFTLFIGGTGAYMLSRSFLIPYLKTSHKELSATITGLFYILNIATIQTYFVAFEAFIYHFAFLPWLIYGALIFMKKQSLKNFLIFTAILIFATPGFYIPTLFVAYILALSFLSTGLFLSTKYKKRFLFSALKAYVLIAVVNAFWLLPFLYFTVTSSNINVDSKMNQMATENIYLQNKEFGDLTDVIQLKGFWFNNVDPDLQGNFRYMLTDWKGHFNEPIITISAFLLFIIIMLGVIYVIRDRRPLHIAFLAVLIFGFTMLATNTPPFSWIVGVFREVPLFGQAFRFPFTKFGSLVSLSYALFLGLGIVLLADLIKKYLSKFALYFVFLLALILIFLTSYPAFNGKLFYEKQQVKLPQEYTQTFDFFKNQDQNTRIANLPQHTFWGWNFYTWGYGGSGFLWYGIKQPILDRAFDVWSDELENYYFELSNALYAKDPEGVINVFNKYKVDWIILDNNVYSPFSPKAVFNDETREILSQIPSVKKVKQFNNIEIYKIDSNNRSNYISTTPILPSVNEYEWNNNDVALNLLGQYKSATEPTTYFPFRSIFSYKAQEDKEFSSEVIDDNISFKTQVPNISKETTLFLPEYYESENIVPVEFFKTESDNEIIFAIKILTPEIFIDGKSVSSQEVKFPIFIIPNSLEGEYILNINGYKEFRIDTVSSESQKTYLSLKQDNVISLVSTITGEAQESIITSALLNSTLSNLNEKIVIDKSLSGKTLEVKVPFVLDNQFGYQAEGKNFAADKNCNSFRNGNITVGLDKDSVDKSISLISENDTLCLVNSFTNLAHDNGYYIQVKSSNKSGRSLHFWGLNLDQKYAPFDIYLPEGNATSSLVLSPMESFGQGYSFHFENVSIGKEKVENTLESFSIAPIPYGFITNLRFETTFTKNEANVTFKAAHPNESLYVISDIKADNAFTLILSQSFDEGWDAYTIDSNSDLNFFQKAFPFLYGQKIKNHIKVNNWENGWEIDNNEQLKTNNSQIVIIYLPQYLQYLGYFILFFGLTIILFASKLSLIKSTRKNVNQYFDNKTEALKLKIEARKISST